MNMIGGKKNYISFSYQILVNPFESLPPFPQLEMDFNHIVQQIYKLSLPKKEKKKKKKKIYKLKCKYAKVLWHFSN